MSETTIAERQAQLEAWYQEWLTTDEGVWGRGPESLIRYLKARLCMEVYG